jgi:hypothetical protein
MMKFNYCEPEFKVVKAATEDVMTASLDSINANPWDTSYGTSDNNAVMPIN